MNKLDIETQAYTTVAEVAVRMGIGIPAATELLKNGLIPRIIVGGRYVVPVRSLDAYEEELGRLAARDYAKREDKK